MMKNSPKLNVAREINILSELWISENRIPDIDKCNCGHPQFKLWMPTDRPSRNRNCGYPQFEVWMSTISNCGSRDIERDSLLQQNAEYLVGEALVKPQ